MADEQDWAAYADQAHIKKTDTILARTSGGAGVEIPGSHVVGRRADGEPFQAEGLLQGGFGAFSTSAGVADWNHISNAIAGSGQRLMFTGDANHPPSGGFYHPFSFEYASKNGGGNMTQFAIPYQAGFSLYYRVRFTDAWAGWQEILSSSTAGHFLPRSDATANLGSATKRFNTVFASTGTINTSDERDKTWHSELSDAEYAAALQIIDELGFYQWNDSIAEKGADARLHFGVRAQRAFAILDEHLGEGAWHRYAFACYDSWDDQFALGMNAEGEPDDAVQGELHTAAGDRYGLREGQFTMFLMAAQARRQTELEQRIAALEA